MAGAPPRLAIVTGSSSTVDDGHRIGVELWGGEAELERVPDGGTALLRVLRNSPDGMQEVFVPVTKE